MNEALVFNTAEELEVFLQDWRNSRSTNEDEGQSIIDNDNPNKVTEKIVFHDLLLRYNIFVEQELGEDYMFFTDYSVSDIDSSVSGITVFVAYEQESWDNYRESYEMTANIYGTSHLTFIYKNVGRVYSEDHHFRVKVNATDGSRISQEWVD